MNIKLTTGTLVSNDNLDGWIITSKTATVAEEEDLILMQGDIVAINGDVFRAGEFIGNVS